VEHRGVEKLLNAQIRRCIFFWLMMHAAWARFLLDPLAAGPAMTQPKHFNSAACSIDDVLKLVDFNAMCLATAGTQEICRSYFL
jgi:hypothetical protein